MEIFWALGGGVAPEKYYLDGAGAVAQWGYKQVKVSSHPLRQASEQGHSFAER